MIDIGRCPPINQPSRGVELAARIVKAVAYLVADDPAHAAVILDRVGIRVEEWRQKDRRREVQGVLERQVNCIDRLRRHPPFTLIYRHFSLESVH